MRRFLIALWVAMGACGGGPTAEESPTAAAQESGGGSGTPPASTPGSYDMGSPSTLDLWVDPVNGTDSNSGNSASQALRTITAAWNSIPADQTLTVGRRIRLLPGTHAIPNYWENRYGTFAHPILIQAENGLGSVTFPTVNVFDCRYLYFIGVRVTAGGGDVFHLEACDHILLRQCAIVGLGDIWTSASPQEAMKVNQSQHLYVEDSDISGGFDNAVDCVGVQYGHFLRNKIHHAQDWCMYLKGGSAYFRVEGNEFYDGGTGGFTAGQGTGFEFMTSPWLHYEAYDIKFVNNVVHDTNGAGFGVNGGYNILFAFNTLYRVGSISHVIEVVFGGRTCDGNVTQCNTYLAAGGWGTNIVGGNAEIPDRNVYIFNNIVYNPPGFQSAWQHFTVFGPVPSAPGSNVPSPVRCDTNLIIRGNVIWNGPSGHPLGLDATNLDPNQILAENSINTVQPQLANPGSGDFHPTSGGNVYSVTALSIPNYTWADAPTVPLVPQGNLNNTVTHNRDGNLRPASDHPGAY